MDFTTYDEEFDANQCHRSIDHETRHTCSTDIHLVHTFGTRTEEGASALRCSRDVV